MTYMVDLAPDDLRRPVLSAFLATMVPLLRQEFRADCCIAAVRLTQAILAGFDLEVTPLPVQVAIFNAAFVRRIERGESWPASAEESRRWADEDGAWTIGIGGGPPRPGHWPGHLVAMIGGTPQLLCDLTLPQANRPARQIILPALLHSVPAPPNGPGVAWWGTTINGATVMYYTDPANQSYRTSHDWAIPNPHPLVRRVAGRIAIQLLLHDRQSGADELRE
jgi:hypothetical protein